jgi:hypothetical protein
VAEVVDRDHIYIHSRALTPKYRGCCSISPYAMGVDTAYGWYGRGMGRRDGRILGGTAGDMYVRARCLVNTALVGLLGMPLAYICIDRYAVICRCLRVRRYTIYQQHNRLGRLLADPLAPKAPPGALRGMRSGTRAARPAVWSADGPRTCIYTGSSGSTQYTPLPTASGSNKTQMPLDWLVFGFYVV